MQRIERLYPLSPPENLASSSNLGKNLGPEARSGHRIVEHEGNIYTYGGYNPTPSRSLHTRNMDEFPMFRELWKFNLASKCWQRLEATGSVPRESASYACVLLNHKLLVLGGTGFPFAEVKSNQLYCCDLTTLHWTILPCKGIKPGKVYGHAMVHVDGYIYLFGGTSGFFYNNKIFRLNIQTLTWELISKPSLDSQSAPSPRYRHEMVTDGELLYILGGGTASTAEPLDKIWTYNILTRKWHMINSKADPTYGYPAARKCHGCVQYKDDVFISGGLGEGSVLALKDIWKYHIPTSQWTNLDMTLETEVYFHATAISQAGTMYTFGGVVPSFSDSNDPTSTRSDALHKVDICIKSLSEYCWEYLVNKHPSLLKQSHKDLVQYGIPRMYLSRLDTVHNTEHSESIVAQAS